MNIESARLSTPSSFERRTSLLVGILGVAGSFAFAGATTDFVVTPVSSTVVDLTPGVVVITTIQLLGTLSELVAFIVALLATVMILSGAALVGNQIGSRTGDWFGVMLGVYFTGWCVAALITRSPVPALAVAIPMGITAGLRERSHGRDTQTSVDDRRRRALKTVAALLGAVGLGTVLGLRDGPVDTAPCQQSRPASEKPSNVARGMLGSNHWISTVFRDLSARLASSTRSISTRSIRISLPQNGASPSRELSKTNRPSTTLTSRRWSQSISSSPSDVGGSAQRRTHGYRALNRCAGPTAPCPYRCARVTCDASGCRRLL